MSPWQCDEKIPECSQCTWSGKQCSGPIVGNIFVPLDSTKKRRVTRRKRRTNKTLQQIDTPSQNSSDDALFKEPTNSSGHLSACVRKQDVALQDCLLRVFSIPALKSPVAQKLDPFSSLPIILDKSTQMLIEICMSPPKFYYDKALLNPWLLDLFYYPRKISTMGPASIWFPLAAKDAVLLQTTFFVCATYYELLRGSRCSALAMRHKALLLQLINERLNDPILGVSDGMVCAIALFGGTEASYPLLQSSSTKGEAYWSRLILRVWMAICTTGELTWRDWCEWSDYGVDFTIWG